MPIENARSKKSDNKTNQSSNMHHIYPLMAASELARFASLGAGVATLAIIPEYVADRVNKSALDQSKGILPPAPAVNLDGSKLKLKGIASLMISSLFRVLSPLPAKIISSSNKNGVRRGSELAKEGQVQEKNVASNEDPISLPSQVAKNNLKRDYLERVKWGALIAQFGFVEALVTGNTSLYATHKTEVANFNPKFNVIKRPQFTNIDSWMKRLHYRTTGITVRTIKNASQILMFPVCLSVKNNLIYLGADSRSASFGASAITGIVFSPAITLLGMTYREQAIAMNPLTFKTISMIQAAQKLPLSFIKKAFWGKPAATNAGLSVAMLLIVTNVEEAIDTMLMPIVNENLKGIYKSARGFFSPPSDHASATEKREKKHKLPPRNR